MSRSHTRASRSAAYAMALLGLVQATRYVTGPLGSYTGLLLLALALSASAAASRMHRGNSLESRLAAGIVAVLSGGGVLLAVTLGAPGQDAQPLHLLGALALILSAAAGSLLVTDLPRRAGALPAKSPYAS